EDVLIWVKAVPGASRDEIAGAVGERLKVRVSAPAEGGRANRAVCRLVAARLGVRAGDVEIETRAGSAAKTLRVSGVGVDAVRSALDGL
ncbi:MAG: DUF167 domain-containing protein, partial [Planctomycetota bacterium]